MTLTGTTEGWRALRLPAVKTKCLPCTSRHLYLKRNPVDRCDWGNLLGSRLIFHRAPTREIYISAHSEFRLDFIPSRIYSALREVSSAKSFVSSICVIYLGTFQYYRAADRNLLRIQREPLRAPNRPFPIQTPFRRNDAHISEFHVCWAVRFLEMFSQWVLTNKFGHRKWWILFDLLWKRNLRSVSVESGIS